MQSEHLQLGERLTSLLRCAEERVGTIALDALTGMGLGEVINTVEHSIFTIDPKTDLFVVVGSAVLTAFLWRPFGD